MTRYQRFIRDSLAKVKTVMIDEELEGIDAKVLELPITDFFNSNNPLFVHDILNYRLTDPSFKYKNGFPDNAFSSSYAADTEEAARFLSKSRSLFRRALGLEDNKLLLTALIIFRRFNCEYEILFDLSELEHDERIWLTNCLAKLSNIKMTIGLQDHAPNYEISLFENYSRGCKQFNISATYQFIDALERSNISYGHYLANEAVKLLYYVDVDRFVEQLEQKREPLEIIPFLEVLSCSEKLKFLRGAHNFGEWIYFEIFRQVLREQTLDTEEENIYAVSTGISGLYTRNSEFLLRTAYYFQSNPLFNNALGVVLVEIRLRDFKTFAQNVELDEFKNQGKFQAICGLLHHLEKHDSGGRTLHLCKTVYKKWRILLDKSLTEEKYFSEPIVTDYFCCILRYLEFRYDTPLKAGKAVSEVVSSLEGLNSTWFKTITERSSRYFALLSILYVSSFLWKSKDFTATSSLKRRLVAVLSDRRTRILNNRRVGQHDFYEEMAENFSIVLK